MCVFSFALCLCNVVLLFFFFFGAVDPARLFGRAARVGQWAGSVIALDTQLSGHPMVLDPDTSKPFVHAGLQGMGVWQPLTLSDAAVSNAFNSARRSDAAAGFAEGSVLLARRPEEQGGVGMARPSLVALCEEPEGSAPRRLSEQFLGAIASWGPAPG